MFADWRLQPFPSKFRFDQLLFLICFTTSYSLQWLIGYVTVGMCFFSESLVVTTRHRCFTGCSPFGICVGNWEEPLRKFSRSQMLQRLFVFWNFKCVRHEYSWLAKSYVFTATIKLERVYCVVAVIQKKRHSMGKTKV